MRKDYQFDINGLREIGWALWDPIGLSEMFDGWKGQGFEDEYDSYLMKATGMLINNGDKDQVVEYLFHIESQHMGIGPVEITPEIRARLLKVIQAISNTPSIWDNVDSIES